MYNAYGSLESSLALICYGIIIPHELDIDDGDDE